jgi:hypothetical protein
MRVALQGSSYGVTELTVRAVEEGALVTPAVVAGLADPEVFWTLAGAGLSPWTAGQGVG